jgi:hypothetical protein
MAARPMLVNATVTITYDGVSVRIPRGAVIDVPAGSTLNTALGSNITALTSQQQIPGSSDSVNQSGLYNLTGGGNDPYNAGQAG